MPMPIARDYDAYQAHRIDLLPRFSEEDGGPTVWRDDPGRLCDTTQELRIKKDLVIQRKQGI